MSEPSPPQCVLELGRDHRSYGEYALGQPAGKLVWAISVGADPDSPSLRAKGDAAHPNEDGLLAILGRRTVLAVADGHYGQRASHELLETLAGQAREASGDRAGVERLLGALARLRPAGPADQRGADDRSATSLIVVTYDAASRRGQGLCYGDSTFALLGPSGHRRCGEPSHRNFVSPARPAGLSPRHASRIEFQAEPGDLLLAYTDGIDECHYRHPETSVRPERMEAIWRETDGEPAACVRTLVEEALAGVDGHPGGQDNIAIVALRA